MKTQLFAPEIDALIESIKWETAPINSAIYQKLRYSIILLFGKKFLILE